MGKVTMPTESSKNGAIT